MGCLLVIDMYWLHQCLVPREYVVLMISVYMNPNRVKTAGINWTEIHSNISRILAYPGFVVVIEVFYRAVCFVHYQRYGDGNLPAPGQMG